MSRRPTPDASERILDAASRLFYDRGINSVGMQEIIETCGCGKNMLYREFGSKDELVAAYLDRLETEWQATITRATGPLAGDPVAQILAVVAAAADDVRADGYRGCAFLNTLAETADPNSAGHRQATKHVKSLQALFRRLARAAQLPDPATVSDELVIIVTGMQSSAPVIGGPRAANRARQLAARSLRAVGGPATSAAVD